MSDPKPQSAGQIGQSASGFLNQSLPDILKAIQTAIPDLAKSKLSAEQATSPAYNDLLTSLYQKYAPQLAKTGSDIESQQRTSTAATDSSILKGSGTEIGQTAENLNKQFNPEFYKGRAEASDKLGQLLGSINLNNANPEAERLVGQESARTGNLATPSQTGTVSNALSFGNELQKRRNALGSALNIASGFLPVSQSNVGLGFAGGTINRTPSGQGTNQFAGVQGGEAAAQGQGLASGIFGQGVESANLSSQLNQQRRDALDRVNETLGGIGSVVSV